RGHFLPAISRRERAQEPHPDRIPPLIDRVEIFELPRVRDGVDVSADWSARERQRIEVALPRCRVDRVIELVVVDRCGDRASQDSVQRAWPRDTLILQLREQQVRRLVIGGDVRPRQAVRQTKARKHAPLQRVTRKRRESRAVLVVVLNVLRVDADCCPRQQRRLLRLVEFVQRRKYREATRDRPVKQVRFRESEHYAALILPHLRRKGQRFAQSQEVVRLVSQPDESSHQPADAALQANRLLALFLQLQQQVNGALFRVALDLRGLVRIQLFEIVQLVQAQNTDFPGVLVEERAFVKQQLAPDDFVSRGGVSGEVDAADVVLLAFLELHGHVNALGFFVDIRFRSWHKVDETVPPVNLSVILERFANFGGRKNVSLFQRECPLQRFHLQDQGLVRIAAGDLQRAHPVAFALFDRDGHVDGLTLR